MTVDQHDSPGGDLRVPAALFARVAGHPLAVAALMELMQRAAWRACKRSVGGREISLRAGELVTSRECFAEATGMTAAQVRRAWERLERAGLISIHANTRGGERGTRITVTHLSSDPQTVQQLTHDGPAVEPETGPRQTHAHADEHLRATMRTIKVISHSADTGDPRKRPRLTHDGPDEKPTTDPKLAHRLASNVVALPGGTDLGSLISDLPDPGSEIPALPEPSQRLPGDRQQQRGGGDRRAAEQRRLVAVIGAAHVAAFNRVRTEIGADRVGAACYVPAMRAIGDPAERTLRELIAAQASVDGLEERLRHVLAVGEAEAREGTLRWFGASLWSPGTFSRALSMAAGEDRRPARASPAPREGITAKALRRVAELEAMEAEEERRAQQGG